MNILSVVAFGVVFAGPTVMLFGLIVMFPSVLHGRIGSPTAARLLLLGPGISQIGGGMCVLAVEFDPFARGLIALLLLASGIAVCAFALRARIRFAPIEWT